MVLELRAAYYVLLSCSYFLYAGFLSAQSSFSQGICSSHTLCPISLQMQRPFALPLQPLASPSSPQHWKAVSSLPRTEELVAEDTFAGPVLQEKPSASSPQHSAVDQSPPAAGPAPRRHVSYSSPA